MGACLLTSGYSGSCDDRRSVGGVKRDFYVGNICDLETSNPFTIDASGYITAINLTGYTGLYKFSGFKSANSGGYETQKQADGGNVLFDHNVTFKIAATTPADDQVIEELSVSEVFVVYADNNNRWKLYGKDNGLDMTAGVQNTGTAPATDTTDQLTFQGQERELPKRVLKTDFNTTKTYLEALVA